MVYEGQREEKHPFGTPRHINPSCRIIGQDNNRARQGQGKGDLRDTNTAWPTASRAQRLKIMRSRRRPHSQTKRSTTTWKCGKEAREGQVLVEAMSGKRRMDHQPLAHLHKDPHPPLRIEQPAGATPGTRKRGAQP